MVIERPYQALSIVILHSEFTCVVAERLNKMLVVDGTKTYDSRFCMVEVSSTSVIRFKSFAVVNVLAIVNRGNIYHVSNCLI